jgi:hypothetical protein
MESSCPPNRFMGEEASTLSSLDSPFTQTNYGTRQVFAGHLFLDLSLDELLIDRNWIEGT